MSIRPLCYLSFIPRGEIFVPLFLFFPPTPFMQRKRVKPQIFVHKEFHTKDTFTLYLKSNLSCNFLLLVVVVVLVVVVLVVAVVVAVVVVIIIFGSLLFLVPARSTSCSSCFCTLPSRYCSYFLFFNLFILFLFILSLFYHSTLSFIITYYLHKIGSTLF